MKLTRAQAQVGPGVDICPWYHVYHVCTKNNFSGAQMHHAQRLFARLVVKMDSNLRSDGLKVV